MRVLFLLGVYMCSVVSLPSKNHVNLHNPVYKLRIYRVVWQNVARESVQYKSQSGKPIATPNEPANQTRQIPVRSRDLTCLIGDRARCFFSPFSLSFCLCRRSTSNHHPLHLLFSPPLSFLIPVDPLVEGCRTAVSPIDDVPTGDSAFKFCPFYLHPLMTLSIVHPIRRH